MLKVHMYNNGKMIVNQRMMHIPRCGDIVRVNLSELSKVTEVIWCLDESYDEGQRVNIRLESIVE